MANRTNALSQSDQLLIRDIKKALKQNSLEGVVNELILEYDRACTKDSLINLVVNILPKEKHVAETIFKYLLLRGPLPADSRVGIIQNEYLFAYGLVYYSILQCSENNLQVAGKSLSKSLAILEQLKASNSMREVDDRVFKKLTNLIDYVLLLMAKIGFLQNRHQEALKFLNLMSAYDLVLEQETFSVIVLMKVMCQMKFGELQQAISTLQRRNLQESSLKEISLVSKMKTMTSGEKLPTHSKHSTPELQATGKSFRHLQIHPTTNARSSGEKIGHPLTAMHLLHDLQIYLCHKVGQLTNAQDCLNEFKGDYHRGTKLDDFVKYFEESMYENQVALQIKSYTPLPDHLHRLGLEIDV